MVWRLSRCAAILAVLLACGATVSAEERNGFVIGAWGGWTSGSGDRSDVATIVDEYGSVAENRLESELGSGSGFGAGLGWTCPEGFGFELLWERMELDLDSKTRFDLAWDSVAGPQSESYDFDRTGSFELEPVSLNLLWRKPLTESFTLAASAGLVWARIDLRDEGLIGLAVYEGDLIDAVAAETRRDGDESDWGWNAGVAVDYELVSGLALFVDARYYGGLTAEAGEVEVRAGTYPGLHFDHDVTLDDERAASAAAELQGSSRSFEYDATAIRAALGLRYRF